MTRIRENVHRIISELPEHVILVAAAKSRTPQEIGEALDAGITAVGENYLQESRAAIEAIGARASWHFIGHIQKNKVKHIVPLFDMIETLDSFELATMIDRHAFKHNKLMPVLIEVNIAREEQKAGVLPERVEDLLREIRPLTNIKVQGLMTMGPFVNDPEDLRPYFRQMRSLFEEIRKLAVPNVEMTHLSMGMSDSYRAAIEEGATMVRIGTLLFGPRS